MAADTIDAFRCAGSETAEAIAPTSERRHAEIEEFAPRRDDRGAGR